MYDTDYTHTAILKMWQEYGKTHIKILTVSGTIGNFFFFPTTFTFFLQRICTFVI